MRRTGSLANPVLLSRQNRKNRSPKIGHRKLDAENSVEIIGQKIRSQEIKVLFICLLRIVLSEASIGKHTADDLPSYACALATRDEEPDQPIFAALATHAHDLFLHFLPLKNVRSSTGDGEGEPEHTAAAGTSRHHFSLLLCAARSGTRSPSVASLVAAVSFRHSARPLLHYCYDLRTLFFASP